MTVAELSASVPSGEYELVRGRGKNEDIQFDFSNPLYAEPEREVVSAIYESVSNVRFLGFCNTSQITGTNVRVIYPEESCFRKLFGCNPTEIQCCMGKSQWG